MAGIAAYFSNKLSQPKRKFLPSVYIFAAFLFLWPDINTYCQSATDYNFVSVFLEVERLGGKEISVIIEDDEVFLPVADLFDFLDISTTSSGFGTMEGFIVDEESSYHIDGPGNKIQFGEELFVLREGDLIQTGSQFYLRDSYFERIFGLACIFSHKNLSVKVAPLLEIPVIQELRQQDINLHLERLTSEEEAESEIRRSYPMFKFGMADWSVYSAQDLSGISETGIDLSLGAVIAGGEASASIHYNSSQPFREKDQHYQWRFVDNYNATVTQAVAGKINPLTTSTIQDPVVGVQFTNTPTDLRKATGTYTLSDVTEPNWIVELYINNVLVEYTMADAAGFFTFEVPLVYGSQPVKLKFYGPWGEEKSRERYISLPYAFVPKGVLEYDINAGIVEDSLRSRLLRTNVNYGVSQNLTLGAGYEYLSSVISSPMMPYARGSFRLASNLILSAEFTYKVRARSILTYRLPSNLQFDLSYSRYNRAQQAMHHNYLEERNASVLMPLNIKSIFINNRLSVNQLVLESSNATTAEWLLSGSLYGVQGNITTTGLFVSGSTPNIYSKLALSYRFGFGLRVTPMAQFAYSDEKLLSLRIGLEQKLIKHAFLNLSFGQDFLHNHMNAELAFRYNFNFAQAGISALRSENRTTFTQYARGSIIHGGSSYFKADKIDNVGKGGITIIPYYDENSNGRRDAGEGKVPGLALRTSAGQIERFEKDTTIRVLSLEAYTKCIIEFDDSGIDTLPLKLHKRTYSVHVDPNMLKEVEVPLIIAGKASGTMRIKWEDEIRATDGIVAHLFNKDNKRVGRVFSKADGSYTFEGLSFGSYVVKIDSIQLQRIGRISTPDSISFDISPDSGEVTITGLDFLLESPPEPEEEEPQIDKADTVQEVIPEQLDQVTRKDSTYIKIHELVQEVTDTTDSYAVQLGAFGRKTNAMAFKDKIASQLGRDVEIVIENGLHKVRILDFESREEVDEFIPVLSDNGIGELWVINLKGMRQEMMLMTVRDTITEVIEIRSEMPDPDDHSNLNLQLGAFRDSARAEALMERLSASLDQPIIILEEDDYFKVRLTGFTHPDQRDAILPDLYEHGFTDVWVLPYDTSLYETGYEAAVEVAQVFIEEVTTPEEELDEIPDQVETEIALPAEEEPVEEKVPDDVLEEEVPEEILEEVIEEEEIPEETIGEEEITKDLVEEALIEEEAVIEEAVIEEAVIEEETIEEVVEEEVIEEAIPAVETSAVQPLIEQPRFSIQVGVFPELSEAKRAQRKILNKLGLESVLVQEYDYTRVLIPGFYTRQETYRYYPELAGIGYDRIQVIEKR